MKTIVFAALLLLGCGASKAGTQEALNASKVAAQSVIDATIVLCHSEELRAMDSDASVAAIGDRIQDIRRKCDEIFELEDLIIKLENRAQVLLDSGDPDAAAMLRPQIVQTIERVLSIVELL